MSVFLIFQSTDRSTGILGINMHFGTTVSVFPLNVNNGTIKYQTTYKNASLKSIKTLIQELWYYSV